MKLSKFKFDLPQELIKQYPAENRDESRLMVLHKSTGKIEHKVFKDVLGYFNEEDLLIFNNTKVFPARLHGNKEKTGAEIEVFLLRELNREQKLWDVLVDPARKIRIGNKLYFGDDELVAEVIDNTTSRGRTLRFLFDGPYEEFKSVLNKLGETPIPKEIIKRDVEAEDEDRYQTIYAKHEGAVAAPTAGLHFSKQLMKRFEILGVDFAHVTLHASLGNFSSVDVEDLTKHKMYSEEIMIDEAACNKVNASKAKHKNVCAVGTTVLRTTESSVSTQAELKPFSGWTNKFLFPPHNFKIANRLITNFHLPYSTLLMTVAAFGGYELIMDTYETAKKEKYNFGTYGDALFIIE